MLGESETTDKLLSYIKTLSPEKVESLFSHLPQLTALLEAPYQPYPQERSAQTG